MGRNRESIISSERERERERERESSFDTSSLLNSLFWVSRDILMGRESFVSANSSSPVRISRDTQNKLFDNCNIVNGKFSISLNVLVIWTILQKRFN